MKRIIAGLICITAFGFTSMQAWMMGDLWSMKGNTYYLDLVDGEQHGDLSSNYKLKEAYSYIENGFEINPKIYESALSIISSLPLDPIKRSRLINLLVQYQDNRNRDGSQVQKNLEIMLAEVIDNSAQEQEKLSNDHNV